MPPSPLCAVLRTPALAAPGGSSMWRSLAVLAVVAVAVVAVAAAVHQRQPIRVVLSEEVALSASLVRELAFGVHLRLVRVPVPQHDHAPHRRGAKRLSQIHRVRARYKGKIQAGPRQQSASSAAAPRRVSPISTRSRCNRHSSGSPLHSPTRSRGTLPAACRHHCPLCTSAPAATRCVPVLPMSFTSRGSPTTSRRPGSDLTLRSCRSPCMLPIRRALSRRASKGS